MNRQCSILKAFALSLAALVAAAGFSGSVEARPLAEAREIAAHDRDEEKAHSTSAEPADAASTNAGEAGPVTLCELIEAAAAEHEIPVGFFTRLIWAESSFRPGAVSPKGAQGIAQFMPVTAAERGLRDPFDPLQAIPASASLLRDLRARFGNLGLAAAAYNAGAQRVSNWLGQRNGLPWETRNYVVAITGMPAEDWAAPARRKAGSRNEQEGSDNEATSCLELASLLARPGAGAQAVSAARPISAPWGVQVAGNFSQDRALASYASLQQKHAAILGQTEPLVIPTRNHSRGSATFYDIRVPAQSRQEAQDICQQLRSSGGNCLIQRN